MKSKAFWFHYNKPASQKKEKPQITVHFNKTCLIVDNVKCSVPTEGRLRSSQPKFVMAGKAKSIEIIDGVALIK